ncbi:uncharacterized protein TNCV_2841551 [Trichonephila clavipes]|uniref:MBD domain-containing protein n=1 Tax=Trichonephila clavipes TaxID=2585209 RepID=A0A8X6RN91_TRICX|nr:uncharacterized protein TNCV_2841551 [Trichonephila clavipes]
MKPKKSLKRKAPRCQENASILKDIASEKGATQSKEVTNISTSGIMKESIMPAKKVKASSEKREPRIDGKVHLQNWLQDWKRRSIVPVSSIPAKKPRSKNDPTECKNEPTDTKPKIKKVQASARIKKESSNNLKITSSVGITVFHSDFPKKLDTNGKSTNDVSFGEPQIDERILLQNWPQGWKRRSAVRKSGKTVGQVDVYYYSPDGTKLHSKPDVAAYIARNDLDLKVDNFDFSKLIAPSPPIKVPVPKPKVPSIRLLQDPSPKPAEGWLKGNYAPSVPKKEPIAKTPERVVISHKDWSTIETSIHPAKLLIKREIGESPHSMRVLGKSRRAASPLVKLVVGEERWKALTTPPWCYPSKMGWKRAKSYCRLHDVQSCG